MASDNESTFVQGDGHRFPPLPQPQQPPLCHLLVTPESSGTVGDRRALEALKPASTGPPPSSVGGAGGGDH